MSAGWFIASVALSALASHEVKTYPQWGIVLAFGSGVCMATFAFFLALAK